MKRRGLFGLAGGAAAGAVLPAGPGPLSSYIHQPVDWVPAASPLAVPAVVPPAPPPLQGSYVSFLDEAGVVVARAPVARLGDSLRLRARADIPAGATVASSTLTLDMGDGISRRTTAQRFPFPEMFVAQGQMTVDYDFDGSPALPASLPRIAADPTPEEIARERAEAERERAEVRAELGWDREPEGWDDDDEEDDRWAW